MPPKTPKVIDLDKAQQDLDMGGLTWAAWRQRVKPADLEAALAATRTPDPTPEPEPTTPHAPIPNRAPIHRPARMTTLTPSRPATPEPTPAPTRAFSHTTRDAPRHTRQEEQHVLAIITRHGPISRTTLLCHLTGMSLATLNAVLATLTATHRATCSDGRYTHV